MDVGADQSANAEISDIATDDSPQTAPSPQKYKVKVDGQELEVDHDELVRSYQLRAASDKRFKSAEAMKREADAGRQEAHQIKSAFEAMKKGDLSLLRQIVPRDLLRKFSEEELMEFIQEQEMDPREKKARDADRRAAAAEKRLEDLAAEREQEHTGRIQTQVDQEIEAELVAAITELGHNIKVTPRLVIRIAEQMQASLLASQHDPEARPLPAKLAAERAWKGLEQDFDEYLARIPVADFIKRLPRSVRDAIRKADVAEVEHKLTPRRSQDTSTSTLSRLKKSASVEDFFKSKEQKYL